MKLNGAIVFDGALASGAHYSTRQFAKSVPKQPDLADDYLHVPLRSPELVARGQNLFVISIVAGTGSAELTDLEVRYAYQNDYEMLWSRAPAELNQPI